MYRIRFHGRGGQGMKTAGRILGTAFFLAGYEVQDAPLYGAERRGAPMLSSVRANGKPINERGIINNPDLVIIADESLLTLPAAGVLPGLTSHSVLLIQTDQSAGTIKNHLHIKGEVLILPLPPDEKTTGGMALASASCGAAGARLCGLALDILEQAVRLELKTLSPNIIEKNLARSRQVFALLPAGIVREGKEIMAGWQRPHWIDLPMEEASISAPAIHGGATSLNMETGDWRILRPVIRTDDCVRCGLCHVFCPEGVISLTDDGLPEIDYHHCKGCLICLAQCPAHAIDAVPEHDKGGKL